MIKKKYIFPMVALGLAFASCDDQIMEWRDGDPTVSSSEIPLEVREKLALYKPIKEYVKQYHPEIDITCGMTLDMFLENEAYRQKVLENFTGVTFGNAMKHQSIVSASGTSNWSKVDQFIAMNTGLKLHGHNILWHTQQQQTYLKSLIAPKLIQESSGGGDGIDNVLVGDNSDFEGGTSGGWGSWGNGSSKTVEAGAGIDGSYAMVLVNPTDADAYSAQCAYTFGQPLQTGVEYKVSFKAKSNTAAGSLQFQYQNSETYGMQGCYATFTVGTDWMTCEASFTLPEENNAVDRIIINFGAVAGTYYIDDIRFGLYDESLIQKDPMENILVGDNSDFEGGSTGGWGSWGNSSSKSVEAGEGVDGSAAMALVNPTDADYWSAQCAYTFDQPLEKDVPYIIQFQARSNSGAGTLQFQYQNSETYGSQGAYTSFDVGTDWVTCEKEFTITDYDDVNRILINFGKVAGTYYIDNIKFGKKIPEVAGKPRRAASYHYELKTAEEKRAILLEYMESWIKECMEHAGSACSSWDVVNEPIHDNCKWRGFDGAFMSSSDGEDTEPTETTEDGLNLNWENGSGNGHWYWGYFIGRDYAAKAFEYAAKYNPNGAKLFVNDYNLETNPSKLAELIKFVEYIDANGGHVDGIGTQMHVSSSITKDQVDAMFKTMAATGKLVRVTELDVTVGTTTPSADQLQQQSDAYQMIIESYFENVPESQRSAITLWGLSDKADEHQYWLSGDAPNIFDQNYDRKTAYKGVCDAIAGQDLSEGFNGDQWKELVTVETETEE